jgi:hypothetical protein
MKSEQRAIIRQTNFPDNNHVTEEGEGAIMVGTLLNQGTGFLDHYLIFLSPGSILLGNR